MRVKKYDKEDIQELIFSDGLHKTFMWNVPPQHITDPKLRDLAVQYIILMDKLSRELDLNMDMDL